MNDYKQNTKKEKTYTLSEPIDTSQDWLSQINFNFELIAGKSVKTTVPRLKYTEPSLESKVLLKG